MLIKKENHMIMILIIILIHIMNSEFFLYSLLLLESSFASGRKRVEKRVRKSLKKSKKNRDHLIVRFSICPVASKFS